MKTIGTGNTAGGNRGGYGMLLMMLVTMAVALIFYMVWTSGPAIEIGKGATDEMPPWKEWERLRVKLRKEAVGRPSAEQPELSNPLGYAGAAYEGDADRGEISLFITPDGNVMGSWAGQYYITKKLDHQIMMCPFNGYINPSKEYEDANGVDASQLYFIAKGPFSILETNAESGRVRNVMGNIYATGWMNKEHYVYGRITITSDDKHFKAYYWEGPAREDVSVPVMQGLPGM